MFNKTQKHMLNCQGDVSTCQKNTLLTMDELLRLDDSCPVQKTLKTTCKWAAVRWWALPRFRGRSRYSAEWQFKSTKHISLERKSMLDSLVYLPQLSQPGYFTAHGCGMVFCTAIRNVPTITQEQSAHSSWCLFIFSQSFCDEKWCFVLLDFCTLTV